MHQMVRLWFCISGDITLRNTLTTIYDPKSFGVNIYVLGSYLLDWFLCLNGISTFVCYSLTKPKTIRGGTIKVIAERQRNKRIHVFTMNINPKVNVTAWLWFQFAYYDLTVKHFSHFTRVTSLFLFEWNAWNHISLYR